MDLSTAESQATLITEVMGKAKHRMLAMSGYGLDDIESLMLQRMRSIGFEDYGDESFHKSVEQLRQECFEEFADALFYCCLIEMKENESRSI
jgi:hypothetical protein